MGVYQKIASTALAIVISLVALSVNAQVRPDFFPEVTNPDSSNFELYSQKDGLSRRANLWNLKEYFTPDYSTTALTVDLSTGDTISTNFLSFVTDLNGDVFFVDGNGIVFQLSTSVISAPADTSRFIVYAPSHGLTDTIATYGYVPVQGDYTRANATSLDSTHFAYAVDAPTTDSLELKFSGTLTVSSHGLTVGRLYYLQESGPDGTTPGVVRAPTVYVLDANTLVLTEVGADQDQVISRQAVPSPVFTFWGGDPQNPSDSIMQIVVDSVFKPAGLAKPSTIFFMSYSSQSKNPTYQDDTPTDSPLNPSHSWFYDGNVVTRMNHLLTSVDLQATTAGLFSLDTVQLVGGIPTDDTVADWLDSNYVNNGLRLPNGSILYWKGYGTAQSPDYAWTVIDDITNTAESNGYKRILKRVVYPAEGDGNGLIDSLPLGSVSILADTNNLSINKMGRLIMSLAAGSTLLAQESGIDFYHSNLTAGDGVSGIRLDSSDAYFTHNYDLAAERVRIGVQDREIEFSGLTVSDGVFEYRFPKLSPSSTLGDTTVLAWVGDGAGGTDPVGFVPYGGTSSGTTNSVDSIQYVTDTTGLSPIEGDAFVNSTKDTLGLYSGTGWVLFYGGGGAATQTGSTFQADGSDTLNLGLYNTTQYLLDSVSIVTGLIFSNPAQWSQYNIHLKDANLDTIYFPPNLLVANGDTMGVRLMVEGELLSFFYDGTNYYAPSFVGASIDTAGWSGVDLNVSKVVSNSTPAIGDTVTWTITITNQNTINQANNITVKDYIPANLSNIHNISDSGSINGSNDTITWTISSIAPSANEVLTFDTQVDDTATNTAEITAVDETDTDNSDDSDSATVTVTADTTLPVTNNLVFHLIGDYASAGAWPDSSGNNYSFSQDTAGLQPAITYSALNGHAVVDFDGSDDYMYADSTIAYHSGQYTVFVVVQIDDTTQVNQILDADDTSAGVNNRVAQYIRSDANQSDYRSIAFDNSESAFSNIYDSGVSFSAYDYVTVIRSTSSINLRVNGTANSSTGTTGTPDSDIHQPHIGRRMYSPSYTFMDGKIAEIIFYNAELSAGDITTVETYLANKYGL